MERRRALVNALELSLLSKLDDEDPARSRLDERLA
jgi:hypothetical protein